MDSTSTSNGVVTQPRYNELVSAVFNNIRAKHEYKGPRGLPVGAPYGRQIVWAGQHGKLLVPEVELLVMIKKSTLFSEKLPEPWTELGSVAQQIIARSEQWLKRMSQYYEMGDINKDNPTTNRRFFRKLEYKEDKQLLMDVTKVEYFLGMIISLSAVYDKTILGAMRARPAGLSKFQERADSPLIGLPADSPADLADLPAELPAGNFNNVNTAISRVLALESFLGDLRRYDDFDDDVRRYWDDDDLKDYGHDMVMFIGELLKILKGIVVDVGGVPAADVANL